MARFIYVAIWLFGPLACSGGGGPPTGGGTSGSGSVNTDPSKPTTGCMQSSDGSGIMHSVCCDYADETPVNTARCGSKVPAIGCYSETRGCNFYTMDPDDHVLPCPTGLSCEECRSNDDAGLIYACQ